MKPERQYGPLCAEFYAITKPIGGIYPDVPYYLEQLRGSQGPILEAAVGGGRLLIPLLEAGLDVEGIDISEAMLAYCRRHCAERGFTPPLYEGRLETLALPRRYQAIVLAFGSFMLLTTDEALAALNAFWRHLTPGGKLYLDLDAPHLPERADGVMRFLKRVRYGTDKTIALYGATRYDMVRHIEENHLRYEKYANGRLVAEECQDFSLRWYGLDEIILMLCMAGFTDIVAWADYNPGQDATTAQNWLCFQAKKPARPWGDSPVFRKNTR